MAGVGPKRREQSVFDGATLLGTIAENKRFGFFRAWDARGRRVGRFQTKPDAENALAAAARAAEAREAATAAALAWVNRSNPKWVSGLPGPLVGRRW